MAATENMVNGKSFTLWLKNKPLWAQNHLRFDFTFKQFSETTPEERELEHTPHAVQNPSPSSGHPTVQNPSPSLPSNHFLKKKKKKKKVTEPREREREADRLNLRSTPPPFGPCLSPLICPISLFLLLPPMSPIYPFSLYPCRANHRKRSNPLWPSRLRHESCLRHAILPLPILDWTQLPLSFFLLLSIWPDLLKFFFCWVLFLLCLSIEKWYYIFVWKLRKCEQQVENVFSIVFSRIQPNIRKCFSKHFLKCNQTLENIFIFWKYLTLGKYFTLKQTQPKLQL